jgi:hypothetical protein
MNRTEVHPIELAIGAALVVAESLLVLVAAAVALVLTLANWKQPAPPEAPTPPPAPPDAPLARGGQMSSRPATHPLAQLATELEAMPATTLRAMAGTRSKRHTKAALIAMVAACS